MIPQIDEFHKKTRRALLWMNLAHEPFLVLYTLIPFVMRSDLDASLLQLSILSSLRPVLPVFSFYWSSIFSGGKHLLRANLIGAWVLARLPFLFVPWIDNAWYLIFCCACYELFNKSGIPALIEILKINIPKSSMNKIYTLSFVTSFVEGILLGIFLTGLLEHSGVSWRACCGIATLISLSSILAQMKLVFPAGTPLPSTAVSFGNRIVAPWKEAFALLKSNPDFARFQHGFMIGGFGLMLAAPSLALFYVDHLQLSHSEITLGRSVLMGIGIVGSSFLWKRCIVPQKVSQITISILFGFAIYLALLYFSSLNILLFYGSYLVYGITQAGSHLLWNLSGLLFSGHADSAPFSRVNILTVGLRGCIAPALGGVLCNYLGPAPVLLIGSLICLFGCCYMARQKVPIVAQG